MTNAVAGLGLAPDAAMVTFPIETFLPGSDIGPVEARKQEFYDGLTRWRSAAARASRRCCAWKAAVSRRRSRGPIT